jgi:hypothetical protein
MAQGAEALVTKFEHGVQDVVGGVIWTALKVNESILNGFQGARRVARVVDEVVEDAEMAMLVGQLRREVNALATQPTQNENLLLKSRRAYLRTTEFIRYKDESRLPPPVLGVVARIHRMRRPVVND